MNIDKAKILNNIGYTDLVYERINKKLSSSYSKQQIEEFILDVLNQTNEVDFKKVGKNFYVKNISKNIVLTINSNTYRIITVDRITKENRKNVYNIEPYGDVR